MQLQALCATSGRFTKPYPLLASIAAQEGSDFAIAANESRQPEALPGCAGPGSAYQLILGGVYAFKGRGGKVQASTDGLSNGPNHPLTHTLEESCTMQLLRCFQAPTDNRLPQVEGDTQSPHSLM